MRTLFAVVALGGLAPAAAARADGHTMDIGLDLLRDKIRGGWAGQMIGVSYGAPTEFNYLNRIVPEDELPQWQPEMVRAALNQDDLYVDITLAEVLDRKGLDASTEDFGALFATTKYPLWHANLAARRALRRGVPATLTGTPRYNPHANDIDFQIEADFIGLMSPGLPQESNALGYRAGRVMNYGDGIYGGMFVGAMYAAAFVHDDPAAIVAAGLAALPAASPYAAVIRDTLAWHRQHPADWQQTWHLLTDDWGHDDVCPAGAARPFNIDAKLNGAFIALGLLYGGGDFATTLEIATRAGQDSDCNPSSALGILGVVSGYGGIPARFTSGIPAIADEHFSFTTYSFNDIVESTLQRALLLIERTGGTVDGDTVTIRLQEPRPAALEVWDDYGTAQEVIGHDDGRWQWHGNWRRSVRRIWRNDYSSHVSGERGAEARIAFSGTGAVVTGLLLPEGGTADVYLDGEFARIVDVYSDEPDVKSDESIWHAFGLDNGPHELRIVVRGEPFGDSSGRDVSISALVVYE